VSFFGAAVIAVGVICAELGVVATVPLLLSRGAGLAGRLPLTARFALREAVRHRLRTASAVSAVLAVVAGAVTLLVVVASRDATGARDYRPGMAYGDAVVAVPDTATAASNTPAGVRAAVRQVLPAAGVWPLRQAVTATGRAGGGSVVLAEPARSGPCVPPPSPTGAPPLPAGCFSFSAAGPVLSPGAVLVADDQLLRILTGAGYADAKAALTEGRAVTFDRAYLDAAGRISLLAPPPEPAAVAIGSGGGAAGPTPMPSPGPPAPLASLPALYVAASPSSGAVLLPASRLAGLHLSTRISGYYLHPTGPPTAAEQARLTAAVARAVGW